MGLKIDWQNGETEIRQGEALAQLEQLVKQYEVKASDTLPDFRVGQLGLFRMIMPERLKCLTKRHWMIYMYQMCFSICLITGRYIMLQQMK